MIVQNTVSSSDDGNNINSFLLALHHHRITIKVCLRIDVPVSHALKNILCSRTTYCRINHLNILASLRMRVIPINLFPSVLRSPFFFVRLTVTKKYLLREQCDEWRWHLLGSVTIINERILYILLTINSLWSVYDLWFVK